MSKALNLREGSYSHAKLSLYTVYEYVYLQVQAIPHDYARLVTERLLTPSHLPQPVQHRRALGYELSHAFPCFPMFEWSPQVCDGLPATNWQGHQGAARQ